MAIVYYVYRFRLYPKREQADLLKRQVESCRFLYNKLLEIVSANKDWNVYEYKKLLPALKEEYPFLKEVPAITLQEIVWNLNRAFKNFFEGRTDYPKPKNKDRSISLTFYRFRIEGNKVTIPKLSTPIRFIKHREIEGIIKNISITVTPSDKYFLNIRVKREMPQLPDTDKKIAIDLGLTHFCVLSDGTKIESPKYLIKTEEKLKRIQRELSKKQTNSRRWRVAEQRMAKLHEKIKNQRLDFLHKLSKKLINDNKTIIVESLNINGMLQNHHLAKHIADSGWYKFIFMLDYKAKFYNRTLVKAELFYPSSKLCSVCGYKNESLTLSDREWVCPKCGTKHDRDINAALNLLKINQARH